MKKKEFPYYDKDYDEEKGLFIHKYFDSDEWGEMELIIDENKVIGACYDDFSPSQYNNILKDFEVFDWTKTVNKKKYSIFKP